MNRIKPSRSGQILRRGGTLANHTNLHFHIDRLTLAGLPRINQDERCRCHATETHYVGNRDASSQLESDLRASQDQRGRGLFRRNFRAIGTHLANEIMRHIARAETTSDLTEPVR